MNNRKKANQRSIWSTAVEPFKQLKIGIYVISISILFVCLMSYVFLSSYMEQYQQVLGLFNVVDPDARWDFVLNDVFKKNAIISLSLLFGYILILIFVVFKMTHKVYGPLVSIERFIGHLTKGEYSKRLSIRDNDDLNRLVSTLNKLAQALEDRHKKD